MVFEEKIIKINKIIDENSVLSVIQNSHIPFEIKRIFLIKGMKPDEVRGKHAHYKNRQAIFCIEGDYTLSVDDGKNKEDFSFKDNGQGFVLEPNYWHTMHSFSEDCILLVLASEEYDKKDYIKDYEKFKEVYLKKDNNLK